MVKMEKESDDKSAEKSADLKNREGMMLSERHQQILVIMEAGVEYSTEKIRYIIQMLLYCRRLFIIQKLEKLLLKKPLIH